jgi:general L-amino acid transport system substrate-binding protein
MKRTTTKVLLAGIAAACLTAFTAPASAQSTLDAVKKRGKLICGVSQVSAGFAFPDSKGVMQGFDVDICRAVSAAIFGSGDKVDFLATNINTRFQVLQSGEIDILSRQTTQTFSRDNSLGLDFGPVVFYDGQGMMVPKKLNITSAKDLEGAAICVLPGTTTLQNLSDFFRTLNKKFESVVFENTDENRNAFFTGRCDATSTDRSDLASIRAVANNPADYVVLPETISKEPLAPVVRQGDSNWRDILNWTVYTLIAAEEKGITKENIDQQLKSEDPEIQRMLGISGDFGKMIGLDNKWSYNIIKSVGNYSEVFERSLGEKTPLGLTRGPNQLWTKGGLLYAPPFR